MISCIYCGEMGEIRQATEPDQDGIAEFYCCNCGEHFTAGVNSPESFGDSIDDTDGECRARYR